MSKDDSTIIQVLNKQSDPQQATKEAASELASAVNMVPNNDATSLQTSSDILDEPNEVFEPLIENSKNHKTDSSDDSSESDWDNSVKKTETKTSEVPSLTKSERKKLTAEVRREVSILKARLKLLQQQTKGWNQDRKYRVNTKFVSVPKRKIEGDTPIRPFPKELLWYDPKVSGTASEVFDMLFPNSSRIAVTKTPWTEANFSAPAAYCKNHELAHQELLRSYNGVSAEENSRQQQLKVLENLQELLWMMHYERIAGNIEKTYRLMIEQFDCRFDEHRRLKFITNNDLSLIWNKNFILQNSSIMGQREADWRLRPVFIDGLAFVSMLIPFKKSSLPIIPTKVLLELITHFILDGHKTVIYLPTYYQISQDHTDNDEIFKYLVDMNLIVFVDVRSRKAMERKVIIDAGKDSGIIVSPSETLSTVKSIQCFPIVHKYSNKFHEFVLTTFFRESDEITARLDKEVDRRTAKLPSIKTEVPDHRSDSEGDNEAGIVENECQKLKENTNTSEVSDSEPRSRSETYNNGDSTEIDEVLNENDIGGYESTSSESSPDSVTYVKWRKEQRYQNFAQTCRLYSHSEKQQIDTSSNQLTLELQVQLMSSFVQFTVFHFQRHRQIQVFFLLISRHVPELLPHFMKKAYIHEIGSAIGKCKESCQ